MNKATDCFQQDHCTRKCSSVWYQGLGPLCGGTQVRTNAGFSFKPDALNKQQRSTGSSEAKIFYFHANVPSVLKQKEMLRKYRRCEQLAL